VVRIAHKGAIVPCREPDIQEIGARGGIRTPDARLRTAALYPLSYTGQHRESC
jgi:hypothetical protein